MATNRLNLTGKTFGRWLVIRETARPEGSREQGVFWLCQCTCGITQAIPGGRLNAGRCQRGCEQCRSHLATKGGMTPEYQSWRGMRERCLNPNHASFKHYGGKGVKVCSQWLNSFEVFRNDMGLRPVGYSLDRINPNGDYEPSNCRWADVRTQSRNKSDFVLSDEQIAAIRVLLTGGAKQIDVAQAVGVSRAHIANIALGHSRAA